MNICYDSKFSETNCELQLKPGKATRQRNEYIEAVLESNILRDVFEQKNAKILDLTRANSELRGQKELMDTLNAQEDVQIITNKLIE
jgi:hypothetical protein